MSIEHWIHSPDPPLDAMDTDPEGMPTRRSVAALEESGGSGLRRDRGTMAVDAAALVLAGMEVADVLLHVTSLSPSGSVSGRAGSLIAILIAWYFARARDRFGYWLLAMLAGSMLVTSLPRLPDATALGTMLLASRAMAGALAIALLLGPARRYGTGDAPREAGGG